jgi:hypothetical protein
LHAQDQVVAPPYNGELWIDPETGMLLRLQVTATQIPRTFPLRSAEVQTDYGEVSFGDGRSFVLPLQSVITGSEHDGKQNRNVLEFRNCHKFGSTSRIVPH